MMFETTSDLLELSKDQSLQIKQEILVETLDGLYRKYTLPCSLIKIEQNQKIVDKIQKRLEINLAVLMGKCPLDENLKEYQLRYQQVEKEQKLIKNILQDDGKDIMTYHKHG